MTLDWISLIEDRKGTLLSSWHLLNRSLFANKVRDDSRHGRVEVHDSVSMDSAVSGNNFESWQTGLSAEGIHNGRDRPPQDGRPAA